ncbi:hypothetical protein D918_04097 [Trichuris suis]|nr:hypothetical protein D918_04097 [Trichuris suis]
MLVTRSGRIPIEHLQIGDEVADITSQGQLVYSKVYAWLRKDNLYHTFVRLTTVNGGQSLLTPNHLIFRGFGNNACTECPGKHEVVLANHIKVGDTIFLLDKIEMVCQCATVATVELLTAKGAYAPATMSGSLLVDNTLVSCYTSYWFFDLVGHYFADRVIFAPLKIFYAVITNLLQAETSAETLEVFMHAKEGALWYVDLWKIFRSAVA